MSKIENKKFRILAISFCISLLITLIAFAFAACAPKGTDADYYLSLASTEWQTYDSNDSIPDEVHFTSVGDDVYTLEIVLDEGDKFTVNQVGSENKIGFDKVFSSADDLVRGDNDSIEIAHSGTFVLSYYATDDTLTYNYTAQPVSVKIATTVANLYVGDKYPYKAAVVYSNGDEIEESAEWTSSNEEILSVDKDGVVSALAKGTATLTATAHGFTSEPLSITVSMSSIPVTGIQLDKQTLAMEFGDEQQLTASVQPEDADDQRIIWQSDNESAVTVSQDGTVKAVGYGEATITATTAQYGFHAECVVTVVKHVEAMRFVSEKLTVVAGGKTKELGLVFSPSDATDREVEIEVTSGNSYATVEESDGKFVLRGLAQGTATITATLKENREITATCEVTVLAAGTELASMDQDIRVMIADEVSLEVSLEKGAIESVDWSVANEAVATVSGEGATAKVKGVDFGSTVVTAIVHMAGGASYTATCNVLVADEWYFVYGYGLGKADWDYADYVSDKNAAQVDELLFTEKSKGIYTLTRHLTPNNGFQIIFPQVASFTQHDDSTGEDVWSKNIPSHWVDAVQYFKTSKSDSQYVKNSREYFCVDAAGVYTVTLDLTGTKAAVYIKMEYLDVTQVWLEASNGDYVISQDNTTTVSFGVEPTNAAFEREDVFYLLTSDYADYAEYLSCELDFEHKTLTLSALSVAPQSFTVTLHLIVNGVEQTLDFYVLSSADTQVPVDHIAFEKEKYEFNVNNGKGNWTTTVKASVNDSATNQQVRYYDVTDYDLLLPHSVDERAIVDSVTGEVTARSLGTLKIKAVSLDNPSFETTVDVLFYSDQFYIIGGSNYNGWNALGQDVTTTDGTGHAQYTFTKESNSHYTYDFAYPNVGDQNKFKIVFLGIDANWTGEINADNAVHELSNVTWGWETGCDIAEADQGNICFQIRADYELTIDLSMHKPMLLIKRSDHDAAKDYVLDFSGSTELKFGETAVARLLNVPMENFTKDFVTVTYQGNDGYLQDSYDEATNTLTFTVVNQEHAVDKTVKVDVKVKNTTNSLTFTILAEHHLELTWDSDAHWYKCTDEGCSYYEDESGAANQKTFHSVDETSWSSNAQGHYHACSGCGFESGLEVHTYNLDNNIFDFLVTECSECGFKLFEIEGNTLNAYYGNASTVKVPDYVTVLGAHVFEGHGEIVTLTYSDQLTTIGDYAFAGCTKLDKVTIGNRVTKIGRHAFDGTTAAIEWGNSMTLKDLAQETFYGYLGSSLVIPTSVQSIGAACFAYSALNSFEIPDTILQLGGISIFEGCVSLRSVIIGKHIDTIPARTFSGCTSLKTVLIKSPHFYQIKTDAFAYCNTLQAVYICRPLNEVLTCNWLVNNPDKLTGNNTLLGKLYVYSQENPGSDPCGDAQSEMMGGYFRDYIAGTFHWDESGWQTVAHILLWDEPQTTSLVNLPALVDDKRGYPQA